LGNEFGTTLPSDRVHANFRFDNDKTRSLLPSIRSAKLASQLPSENPTSGHNPPETRMSSSSSTVTASSATRRGPINTPVLPPFPSDPPENRIPVTPALLRAIFASSRTTMEERSISRVAFFRYGFSSLFGTIKY
jgi:hypothetical protein